MQEENNKLFVGNISYQTNDASLKEAFDAIDGVEVVDAKVITDRESGRSRGFGFVTLADAQMAQKAIDEMNNKDLDGRTIFVSVSKPKTDR